MRCTEAQEQLVAAHDGELGPSARALLEEHLATCARCRAWDDKLRALMVGAPLVVPHEIQQALEQKTDPQYWMPVTPQRRTAWPLIAVAAALLIGISIARSLRSPLPQEPTVATTPISADDWQPTSYQPEAGGVPTYDTNRLHLPARPADGEAR